MLLESNGTLNAIQLSGEALLGVAPHLPAEAMIAYLPSRVMLGRVRPKAPPMALSFRNYMRAGVAAPPPTTNRRAKAVAALARMYMNDIQGCCVISGKYHSIGLWTGNDGPSPLIVSDTIIQRMYNLLKAGPGDSGCVIKDVLDYMVRSGLPDDTGALHRIDGYVGVDWTKQLEVTTSSYLWGAPTIGINFPEEWTRKAVWDVTNSQILGGHDVPIIDYDANGVYVSSWGRIYLITWRALMSTMWIEEMWALLGPDWYGSDKLAPNMIDATTLLNDLRMLGGGTIPPVDPTPPPPPPVPPPPIPPPPIPPTPNTSVYRMIVDWVNHKVDLTNHLTDN